MDVQLTGNICTSLTQNLRGEKDKKKKKKTQPPEESSAYAINTAFAGRASNLV